VSYELRALAGLHEVAARAAAEAGIAAVELPQGYGLVPIDLGRHRHTEAWQITS
jgi:hypothetical protein